MKCRHCQAPLELVLADLGAAPPSNSYLTLAGLHAPERSYPLRVLTCTECWLTQTDDYAGREEFFSDDYAYFSSYSSSWLAHCRDYTEMIVQRLGLSDSSKVVELAANDGYLLQYFLERGIPCLGVEPTASTAVAARQKGLRIVEEFFSLELGHKLNAAGDAADLIVSNNVLAHVPDINDFVSGIHALLKPEGVATFEFPHLLRLVGQSQFDTIYHEHFSYLSLIAVQRILQANGLSVFDVQQLPTHGGSLRIFAQRADIGSRPTEVAVATLLQEELAAGMATPEYYGVLQNRIEIIKRQLLRFLLDAQERGESVVAYGAAAKGNTLLNYCGVRSDLIDYVVDRNPAKQGRYLPGSRIPVVAEDHLASNRPRWILILPWNLRDEIVSQLGYARSWGAQFVTAIPSLERF